MQLNIKLLLSRLKTLPRFLLSSVFVLGALSSFSACGQPNELKPNNETSLSSRAKQDTKNIEEVAPKLGSQTYLTDAEKAQLKTELDLSHLALKARIDFLRRLQNESDRAKGLADIELARDLAQKNLHLRQDVIKDFPDSYFDKLFLALSLSSLGLIEQQANNHTLARSYLNDSLAQLKDNPPDAENESLWLRLVMWRHRDLGHLNKELKDYQAAQTNYETYLDYVLKNPSHDDHFLDHAEAYFFLGKLFLERALWPESAENYERSIRLLEKHISQYMKRDELIIRRRLAETYGKYAYAAFVMPDFEKANIASENFIRARKLVLKAPGAQSSDELQLALAYIDAAKYSDGKDNEYNQSALDIFDGLKAKDTMPNGFDNIIKDIKSSLAR